jgi:hypothetical protein
MQRKTMKQKIYIWTEKWRQKKGHESWKPRFFKTKISTKQCYIISFPHNGWNKMPIKSKEKKITHARAPKFAVFEEK